MNLWFRVLWLFLTAPFRARIEAPFGVSRLHFRVWPLDLDTNLHLNNGRYLTIADLGRADLLTQTGLWKAVFQEGLMPMLSGSAIRYRRELKPFQAFTLESRIVCWRAADYIRAVSGPLCLPPGWWKWRAIPALHRNSSRRSRHFWRWKMA